MDDLLWWLEAIEQLGGEGEDFGDAPAWLAATGFAIEREARWQLTPAGVAVLRPPHLAGPPPAMPPHGLDDRKWVLWLDRAGDRVDGRDGEAQALCIGPIHGYAALLATSLARMPLDRATRVTLERHLAQLSTVIATRQLTVDAPDELAAALRILGALHAHADQLATRFAAFGDRSAWRAIDAMAALLSGARATSLRVAWGM